MKVYLMIFGICFTLCLNAAERQKDTKTDSLQAQQTTQINADSKNKLIVPLEEITDENLLKLIAQTQKILESKKVKKEKIKQAIQDYHKILKNHPHKDQVYSIPIKTMSAKIPIDLSEYWEYAEGYQDYFLEQNKSLVDSINAKMNALEDIDAKDYELFKELEGFARAHFLEKRYGTWWEKVDLYYEQQNTEYNWTGNKELWYEFLTQDCASDLKFAAYSDIPLEERNALLAQAEPICQKEMAFAKKYFESIHLGEEVDKRTGRTIPKPLCFWSDGVKACDYKLKMPLKLTGTLKVVRDYGVGDCKPAVQWIEFESDSKELLSFLQWFNLDLESNVRSYEVLQPHIPQWFKDNLAGEIELRAEIEAGDYFRADFSACGSGHSMAVRNVNIIKFVGEKLYDREKYPEIMRVKLASEDSYVNLRESPNGKILRRIELGSDYLLWNLGEVICYECDNFRKEDGSDGIKEWQKLLGYPPNVTKQSSKLHSPQWLKVLYFPPNVDDAKKAVIGYIHKSQIERESSEQED